MKSKIIKTGTDKIICATQKIKPITDNPNNFAFIFSYFVNRLAKNNPLHTTVNNPKIIKVKIKPKSPGNIS
jgi:hypothetical protein